MTVVKKVQVPVVGGIRKVIQVGGGNTAVGTTIQEFGSAVVSLAQLKVALGIVTPAAGSGGGAGAAASLTPGPGLVGGGPVIGNVPLRLLQLTPPIVWNEALLPDDWIGSGGGGGGGSTGGGSLATLSDVTIASPTNGQVLTWVSSASKWENQTPAGGGGGTAVIIGNVNPDLHPSSPDPINDEFETASLNAKWTPVNQGSGTIALANGSLLLQNATGSVDHPFCLTQPISGTFTVRGKISTQRGNAVDNRVGLYVGLGGTGKLIAFGFYSASSSTSGGIYVNRYTSPSSFSATPFNTASQNVLGISGGWLYYEIQYDGTNIIFRASNSGISGSFFQVYTETAAAFLGSAPVAVGVFTDANATTNAEGQIDWFRRTDTSGTVPASLTLPYNLTPDTHPANPTAWDDEFEFGTAIDTAGARFSGANPWTGVTSAGTLSTAVAQGALQNIVLTGASPAAGAGYSQVVPSGTWTFVWRALRPAFVVYNNSTWKNYYFGTSGSGNGMLVQQETRNWATGAYTFGSSLSTFSTNGDLAYFMLKYDGTNFVFSWAQTGYNSDFTQLTSQAASGWVVTATNIGFGNTGAAAIDWFRRTA